MYKIILYLAKDRTRSYQNTRIFAPGISSWPLHTATTHFILPRKHADTRSYDTLLDIDRASTGCVRLRTSAGYFPKLVKEKIKDRSISIRLAPSILIPVPLPPPRAAFVFPSYVYPPTMFMSVFFGMPAVKRARAFVHCELLIAREHLSPWINSLCYIRVLTRGYGIAFSQSDNRTFIVLVFHYAKFINETNIVSHFW